MALSLVDLKVCLRDFYGEIGAWDLQVKSWREILHPSPKVLEKLAGDIVRGHDVQHSDANE